MSRHAVSIGASGMVLLAVMVVISFFYGLGAVPLFDLDEGAFSEATREMLASGDFITTFLNGVPRFDKPILIYWLQAGAVSLLGVNEWGFRFPSAICATLWMWVIWRFCCDELDARRAFYAVWIAATCLVVIVIGRAATADALLNLLLTSTLFAAWRAMKAPGPGAYNLVYFWMGLGVLTKGPVAVAIPLVVVSVYLFSYRRWRDWWRAVLHLPGWGILLLIAAPWYILEYLAQGQAFIDGFFMKHNVGRFSDTMEGHGGNYFYYFVAVFLVVMPYGGIFLSRLRSWSAGFGDALTRFLLIWFGFVFVFFSLSSTQLPHYLLYGAVPLFILMARDLDQVRWRWLAFLPALLFAIVLLVLPKIAERAVPQANVYVAAMLERGLDQLPLWYLPASAMFLVAVIAAMFLRRVSLPRAILAVGAVQMLFVVTTLLPWVGQTQQGPVKAAGLAARELRDAPVVMSGINMPSFSVYRGAITPRRDPQPGEWLFTRSDSTWREKAQRIEFDQGGIMLMQVARP